jgi:hypothetical protein
LQDRLNNIQKQKEDWVAMQKKDLYAKKTQEEAVPTVGYQKGQLGQGMLLRLVATWRTTW